MLGKIKVKCLLAQEMHMVNTYYNTQATTVPTFLRLLRDCEIFFSKQYTRVRIRNTVSYMDDDGSLSYGQILYFTFMDNRSAAMMSMLQTLPVPESFLPTKSIIPVKFSPVLKLVDFNKIKEKCIYIDTGTSCFVTNFVCALNID